MSKSRSITLIKLLQYENLNIPVYQRPYEWNKSNVYTLLDDIYSSYKEKKEINLGAIILQKNNDSLDIVDGQQRIITLSLLLKVINDKINIQLLNKKIFFLSNMETKILKNYISIKEFVDKLINIENLEKDKFYKYVKESINFYKLEVKDSNEAFQLFDGRNSKYKDLTPIDLLKAYHLGALPSNYPKKLKKNLLIQWNDNIKNFFSIDDSLNKVEYLYNNILFNIYNWSINKDIRKFNKNDIYLYKGFKETDKYNYVKYYKNNKLYQINKPFKAGKDLFSMTNHYIKELEKQIEDNNLKDKIGFKNNEYDSNFQFINYIYYGALLLFNDKFGKNIPIFYKDAVEDFIYKYSLLLRVKNKLVNVQSLNYYVLNAKCNFFFECNNAIVVEELLKLELDNVGNKPSDKEKLGEMRSSLWNKLM